MKNNTHDLTQGSIVKRLIMFFLPVAAGTIVQQLYNTVDAIIVGRFVGTTALAAVGGSTTQIINLLIGFFVAMTSGASVIVAHFYGERNDKGVSRSSNTGIVFCTFVGLALSVVGEICSPLFLQLMGSPAETIPQASEYLRICFAATTFVLVYNMGAGILRASGDSQRPFYYLLSCCIANIVLDYVFVAVLNWGVSGAAIATAISQIISCVLVLIRMIRTTEAYKISRSMLKIDKPLLKRMLGVGIPSGLQNTMFGFSNAVIQTGVNSLGTTVVAAWSLTGKVDGIYWALINAAGTAVMSFVGQNYGACRLDRVKGCVRKSMIMFSGMTIIISTLIMVFARPVLTLFSEDQLLLDTTWEMLWYFVPYYFTWTAIDVISGTLKGAGDAVVPVAILGLGICAFRIVWVLLIFGVWSHTLKTLALSYVASWVVTDIALFVRYRQWSNAHKEGIDYSFGK